MKLFLLSTLVTGVLLAQDSATITKTITDTNGRRVVEGPQLVVRPGKGESEVTEKTRSINGREVPLELAFGELVREGKRLVTVFCRDTSERARSEEAMRQCLAIMRRKPG